MVKVELGQRTRAVVAGLGVALVLAGALIGFCASFLAEVELKGKVLAGFAFLVGGFGFLLGVIAQRWVCAQ